MFPVPANARIERTKTPEQIRDEAAKAAAADMAALYDSLGIAPNDEMKLQVAAQLFWRHREEIQGECTTIHYCAPEAPCDDATKIAH